VWKLFIASTHATLLFFTDTGRVFARKVYELPEVAPNARGRAMINLLALEGDERIETLLAVRDFLEQKETYLFFATRLGRVKRTPLSDYANIRSNGLRAINVNEGDDLLTVHMTSGDDNIFMATHQGMAIRFAESDVRPMGRTAAGVRGVNLRKGDWVEEVATVAADSDADVLVVTDLGFGKRTPISEFRLQGRGGFGVTLIRLTDRNGSVVGIRCVTEREQLMLVTEGGIVIRTAVSEIRKVGRATQGVRLIRVDDNDRVVSVATVAEQDDEDDGAILVDPPADPGEEPEKNET
jgi:DNA gyrase subunit A